MLDIPLVTRPEPGHEMPEALPPVAGMKALPPNCVPRETLGTRDSKNTKDTLVTRPEPGHEMPEALPPVAGGSASQLRSQGLPGNQR